MWERYDNGDNLLFTEEDYKKPSASKAMRELWQTEDPALQALVGRLAIACGKPIPQTPWLDQFAPDGEPTLLDDDGRREAAAALGITLPVPVPLPPEPSVEVVPPTQPVPTTTPAVVVEHATEGNEVDVELVEDHEKKTRKTKKAKAYQPKTAQKSEANTRVLLFAGAGLLLLVGGVVGGVVMFRGKGKPVEVVEQPADPKVDPKAGPTPPVVTPKPKDNVNPPITPKPPDTIPPEAIRALKVRWSKPLAADWRDPRVRVGGDSRTGQVNAGDGKLVLFDLDTGDALQNPPDTAQIQYGVDVLDGGNVVKTWHVPAGPLQIWNPRTGKEAASLDRILNGPVHVSVSPNGRYLAAAQRVARPDDEGTLKLQDTTTGKPVLDLKCARAAVSFTADSSRVLVAERTGRCRWFKLPSGESDADWTVSTGTAPPRPVTSTPIAASGDGSLLIFDAPGLSGGYHCLVDGRTGRVIRPLRGGDANRAPSLSQDGRLLWQLKSVEQNRSDELVDPTTGTVLARVSPPPGTEFRSGTILPNGTGVFAVTSTGGQLAVGRYDFTDVSPVSPVPSEPVLLKSLWSAETAHYCDRLHVTSTGKMVLAFSGGGEGAAFDRGTGAPRGQDWELLKSRGHMLFPLANERVAKWIYGNTQVVELWNERDGKSTEKLDVPAVPFPPPTDRGDPIMSVSPNARYVALGYGRFTVKTESDMAMRVFDMTTNKAVVSRDWTGGRFFFTADASRVLVAEFNGRCRWYKLPSGEPEDDGWDLGFPAVGRHQVVGASDDGSILSYLGPRDRKDGTIGATLDGKTGALIHQFGFNKEAGFPTTVPTAITADGRRVLVSRRTLDAQGQTYEVADARTGAVVGRIAPGLVHTAALSRDGTTLVLSLKDPKPSVQVYDVPAAGSVPVTPPPATVFQVRWSAENIKGQIHLDSDGKTIAVVARGVPWGVVTFDARTGAAGREHQGLKGNFSRLFPLENGRFGLQADNKVTIWDSATGMTTVPIPAPNSRGTPSVNVSPNGRYVAVGAPQSSPGGGKEFPASPLQVFDVTTGKDVFTTDWHVGVTAFTADSSRILTVDDTGRFRWFKLTDGKLDGEWTFGLRANGFNAREVSISADGGAILYYGTVPGKAQGHHLLDGKDGTVLNTFPEKRYLSYGGSVSDDGRHVMLLRNDGFGTAHTVEVLDARGKLILAVKTPRDMSGGAVARVSWKSRTLVVQERGGQKVTVYDLPTMGGVVTVAPKFPDPKTPGPDLPELKAKWSVECKTKLEDASAYFDDDGQSLVLVATTGAVVATAFNPKTGAVLRDLPAQAGKGHFHRLFGLDKGKFGFQADVGNELVVWDPATGKTTPKPFPAPAAPGGVPSVNVSANGRYLIVGNARPTPGAKNPPESPLKIIDTTTNKVVPLDWHVGATAFTADASRLLVVDDADKFQWFKLPATGKADSEWTFGRTPNGRNAQLMGISARGEVILYHGQPPGKEETVHLLDGKNGTVLHSFPAKRYAPSRGAVSDDGQHVMLVTNEGVGTGPRAEILDARGASLAAVSLPAGSGTAVSWKARLLVVYDRGTRRLTAYELPAAPVP